LPSPLFFTASPPTQIYPLSLHDALPIYGDTWVAASEGLTSLHVRSLRTYRDTILAATEGGGLFRSANGGISWTPANTGLTNLNTDRKSTRLNSSHVKISYAVFCLKKKKQ